MVQYVAETIHRVLDAREGARHSLFVSCLEVGSNGLFDLMSQAKTPRVHSFGGVEPVRGTDPCGLTRRSVPVGRSGAAALTACLVAASRRRSAPEAHVFSQIQLETWPANSDTSVCSKLHLVELTGGPARLASWDKAEGHRNAQAATGAFLALSRVLTAFNSAPDNIPPAVVAIPGNVKTTLVQLLQDVLGISMRTAVICTVSASIGDYWPSRSTIDFGRLVKCASSASGPLTASTVTNRSNSNSIVFQEEDSVQSAMPVRAAEEARCPLADISNCSESFCSFGKPESTKESRGYPKRLTSANGREGRHNYYEDHREAPCEDISILSICRSEAHFSHREDHKEGVCEDLSFVSVYRSEADPLDADTSFASACGMNQLRCLSEPRLQRQIRPKASVIKAGLSPCRLDMSAALSVKEYRAQPAPAVQPQVHANRRAKVRQGFRGMASMPTLPGAGRPLAPCRITRSPVAVSQRALQPANTHRRSQLSAWLSQADHTTSSLQRSSSSNLAVTTVGMAAASSRPPKILQVTQTQPCMPLRTRCAWPVAMDGNIEN